MSAPFASDAPTTLATPPTPPPSPAPAATTPSHFAALVAERDAVNSHFWSRVKSIDAAYHADLAADFATAFPRKKWRPGLPCPNESAIRAHWQIQAATESEIHATELARLDALMTAAALREPIPRTPALRLVATVSASAYHTQGFGASHYARAAAELEADQARFYDIPAEVRPVGQARHDQWGVTYQDYGVFVATTDLGWEMVEHRPGPTLRDWIRLCWKRQLNPRVYDPFLPPGLEETLGLDYFGNELPAAKPSATSSA